ELGAGRELAVSHHVGPADDRVERRAQLVRERREEDVLAPVRLLEELTPLLRRLVETRVVDRDRGPVRETGRERDVARGVRRRTEIEAWIVERLALGAIVDDADALRSALAVEIEEDRVAEERDQAPEHGLDLGRIVERRGEAAARVGQDAKRALGAHPCIHL